MPQSHQYPDCEFCDNKPDPTFGCEYCGRKAKRAFDIAAAIRPVRRSGIGPAFSYEVMEDNGSTVKIRYYAPEFTIAICTYVVPAKLEEGQLAELIEFEPVPLDRDRFNPHVV